jgi:molecular chaperone HtpG
MVFFPEYTDHSVTHLELTLQTALDLATNPSRGLLTPGDGASLVVAVGLHDCGMYLSRDGFESLIARGSRWVGVSYFDQRSWDALWDDFYAEATRFDGRKLRSLFGDEYRPVRPLPSSGAAWEDFDYLLVGEFIRRNHPRLAHEIALHGLPAKDGAAITICPIDSEESQFLADIAGLIARSHGIDLRSCLTYLEDQYHNRINPRGTHVAFLGVLLRIADYFQIQASRAPKERTDVASFQSQLSTREWKVHQSVQDIHNTSGDPEAIVIVANPPDVGTFLKLKGWLENLQEELDRSWAILGEVYGLQNHNDLNLLGMRIRRVKSNIDEIAAFAKTVSYVPAKIAFEVANADLLKLLVAPLYSNDPSVGIRELFQNAVDAVREFDDMVQQHPELASVERYDQNSDVVLDVQCGLDGLPTEINIIDRGIGMTTAVIRDYFLKAGASFRKSNIWRQEHEDSTGHSRVLRTGRFGVGALAAFLLGEEIQVTTRHILSKKDQGITFRAKLDDEAISLSRLTCPVGTHIRISVPERFRKHVSRIVPSKAQKTLRFDSPAGHYFLRRPSLARHFSDRADLRSQGWLPQPEDDTSVDWRQFSNSAFQKIFWTYRLIFPRLACNGIVISQREPNDRLWRHLKMPNLSVFDKDGQLPVNLQRTGLQGKLPFKEDLLAKIGEDILAHGIVEAPNGCESRWFQGEYEGFGTRSYYASPFFPGADDWPKWLVGREGFILNEPSLARAFGASLVLLAVGGDADCLGWGEKVRRELPPDGLIALYCPRIFADTNPRIKGLFRSLIRGIIQLPDATPVGHATYVPRVLLDKIKTLNPGKQVLRDVERIDPSRGQFNWACYEQGLSLNGPLNDALVSLTCDTENPVVFCAMQIADWNVTDSCEPLSNRWLEISNNPLIPFDVSKRSALEHNVTDKIGKLLKVRREAVDIRQKKAKADLARNEELIQPIS